MYCLTDVLEKRQVKAMDRAALKKIYEKIKTPYKYGAVLKLDGRKTDSPVVFKRNDRK